MAGFADLSGRFFVLSVSSSKNCLRISFQIDRTNLRTLPSSTPTVPPITVLRGGKDEGVGVGDDPGTTRDDPGANALGHEKERALCSIHVWGLIITVF